jgi:hypothetical protein
MSPEQPSLLVHVVFSTKNRACDLPPQLAVRLVPYGSMASDMRDRWGWDQPFAPFRGSVSLTRYSTRLTPWAMIFRRAGLGAGLRLRGPALRALGTLSEMKIPVARIRIAFTPANGESVV